MKSSSINARCADTSRWSSASGRPGRTALLNRRIKRRSADIGLPPGREEQLVEETDQATPARRLALEPPAPRFRDAVILRFAPVLGRLPRSFDEALLLEAHQGGIERALVQREGMLGDLFETRGQGVGVQRSHRGQG